MSLEVLENLSMFAGVAARVAANGNGLIALETGSDALQALYAINEIAMHTSEQRGMFTHYVWALICSIFSHAAIATSPGLHPIWESW